MDGDTAESTVDSGNRCETRWVEISERAAQNARLPRETCWVEVSERAAQNARLPRSPELFRNKTLLHRILPIVQLSNRTIRHPPTHRLVRFLHKIRRCA